MILDGQVTLYSTKFADENALIRVLGSGDAVGEIGIIRKKPRSLTLLSNGCSVLFIDVPTFQRTMKITVNKQVEDKISFVSKCFPGIESLGENQRESLAFTLKEFPMRKGQILVNAGEVSEHVYMVFTGEVIIQHKNLKQYTTTDMLRIGPTGSFGEEGVLEGKPFKHNIVCCNDNTTIYKISKDDLIRNFPSYLVNEIKKNL